MASTFVKGNRFLMVMLTFLEINGYEATAASSDYYDVMIAVANRKMNKEQLAKWLEKATLKK